MANTHAKHQATAQAGPAGAYTEVRVRPILGGNGNLRGGTATFNGITFSAGTFGADDHPKVGDHFNINGTHDGKYYEFPNWVCVHSGPTSDFQSS